MGHVLRRPATFVACLLAAFVSISASSTHEKSATASQPRVDVLDNGTVVVSLDLGGDLAGTITFSFERGADGTVSGTWAAQIAHVDNTDPETGLEPEAHEHADGEEHPHKDFVRLIHRGAISGAIDAASLTFGDNGALSAMAVTLSINQGTLEFEGATGTGTATLSQLSLIF